VSADPAVGRGSPADGDGDGVPEPASPDDEQVGAPVGRVLGPLAVWAPLLLVSALLGEHLAHRAAHAGRLAGGSAAVAGLAVVGLLAAILRSGRGPDGRVDARWWVSPLPLRAAGGAAALIALTAVSGVGVATSAARVATTEHGLLPHLAAQGGARPVLATVVHEPRPTATGGTSCCVSTTSAGRGPGNAPPPWSRPTPAARPAAASQARPGRSPPGATDVGSPASTPRWCSTLRAGKRSVAPGSRVPRERARARACPLDGDRAAARPARGAARRAS
jgi:hypothetical protein